MTRLSDHAHPAKIRYSYIHVTISLFFAWSKVLYREALPKLRLVSFPLSRLIEIAVLRGFAEAAIIFPSSFIECDWFIVTRFESAGLAMVSTHVGIQYIYLNNDLNMNTSDQIKSYPS